MNEEEDKLIRLGAISVYAEEFRKFIRPEPASFEIEWLEVEWLNEEDKVKIEKVLKEIAEIYKEALIRKYEAKAESKEDEENVFIPLTKDELEDGLCAYCLRTDRGKKSAVHSSNGVDMCEGRYCDEAYETYLEESIESEEN